MHDVEEDPTMPLTPAFPKYPREHLERLISLESQDLYSVLAFALAAGFLSLASPIAVQALVNTIAFGILIQPLIVLMLTLFGCLALNGILNALQIFLVEMIQRRLFVRLVSQITFNLADLELAQPLAGRGSELANYYFEVMTVQKTWTNLLLDGLGYGLQTLIGLIVLAFYHPALLAFDVMIIASVYFIFRVLGKKGTETAISESAAKYAMGSWLQDLARNPILAKGAGERVWIRDRSDRLSAAYLHRSADHFGVVMKQQSAILALHALANSTLLGLGGWMVIERQLTLGQLVAAELIVSAMLSGLTRLGKSVTSYYDLMAAMDKISTLLDLPGTPQEPRPKAQQPTLNHKALRLETKDLRIQRGDHSPELGVPNFTLEPGEKLLIKLPANAGKTLLVETLAGLRSQSAGVMLINGVDSRVSGWTEAEQQVAVITRPEWFKVSILENIQLGRAAISLQEIHQINRLIGLEIPISRLARGLNTELDERGYPLTHQERWLLSLARSLASQPQLLLIADLLDRLDEAQTQPLIEYLTAKDQSLSLIITTQKECLVERFEGHGKVIRIPSEMHSDA